MKHQKSKWWRIKQLVNSSNCLLLGKTRSALQRLQRWFKTFGREYELWKFSKVLEFRCEAGDKNLSVHFESCHRNAIYRSKIIQNKLTQIISNQILDGIIAEVKKAKFYAVAIADTTDRGLQTQLTTTLRYVDEHSDVKEDFIGYTNITGDTTGENIAAVLTGKLEALDLNLSHIRAQAYDGTGEKC